MPFSECTLSVIRNNALFIFLDYDGTLAPIVNDPAKAEIQPRHKKVIKDLSECPNVRVAIVSGRSLAEIKKKIDIEPLIYMGNHGLEYEGPFMKHTHPVASAIKEKMHEISRKLEEALKEFAGVLVEDKTFTLSVHYRMLAESKVIQARETVYAIISSYLKSREIMIRQGKKVWEIRPFTDWNKGKMILWTLARFTARFSGAILPLYFGDDETDEDAFRVLREKGMTVRITENPEESSCAQYYLKSTDEVYEVLRLIKTVRSKKI